jgi:hypothetical protein
MPTGTNAAAPHWIFPLFLVCELIEHFLNEQLFEQKQMRWICEQTANNKRKEGDGCPQQRNQFG